MKLHHEEKCRIWSLTSSFRGQWGLPQIQNWKGLRKRGWRQSDAQKLRWRTIVILQVDNLDITMFWGVYVAGGVKHQIPALTPQLILCVWQRRGEGLCCMREKPKAVHGTSVGAAIAGAVMQVTHPGFTSAAWPPMTSKAKLWAQDHPAKWTVALRRTSLDQV